MKYEQTLFLADNWKDYALLDSGDGMKLERFASQTVIRPDPQAFWRPNKPVDTWKADAWFDAKAGDDERGEWRRLSPKAPDTWPMEWNGIRFEARRTPFRHMGVFQEHAVHWAFAQEQLKKTSRPAKVLNLFGYTGLMSLACAQAGAEVVHLDASPKSNGFGKDAQSLSALDDRTIRWIADDAMKFVAREQRRGNQYDAIILDPPKFGRGTKNETWRFEEDLPELLDGVASLLVEKPLFVILTAYAVRLSHIALAQALGDRMEGFGGRIEMGEMALPEEKTGRMLPTSICARWRAD
ncbi:class I SAM-dependent rRNA methyltransferase [Henriciella barbarensis]|uniref:Class I SAM-dependent rRNA methyltransferase n=1 Tax=Henriciella barbarensis TaxID=86342 RepID=A0A399R7E2_9PROT|nr:class I SAM-dependent methyltransferase [Henriciella barbarensis]RIJ26055.1 class I SAM-dependent rRNA methyltransferase [Henriciella barbarensis]